MKMAEISPKGRKHWGKEEIARQEHIYSKKWLVWERAQSIMASAHDTIRLIVAFNNRVINLTNPRFVEIPQIRNWW